jgi:hypothetical protein
MRVASLSERPRFFGEEVAVIDGEEEEESLVVMVIVTTEAGIVVAFARIVVVVLVLKVDDVATGVFVVSMEVGSVVVT